MIATEAKPAEHIGRQLLTNSILMILARCAGILTLIISVPFVIAHLGAAGYGVWESMLAIAGIGLVLQTVVRGTMLWRISASYGAHDPEQTRRMVRIGVGVTLTMVAVFLPLVWVIRDSLVVQLQIPNRWSGDAQWILPSIVGVVLLGGINQTLFAVVTGYQRAGFAALVQSGGLVATHLGAVALLSAGFGLKAMLLGYVAGFSMMFALLYLVATSLCGRISLLPMLPKGKDFALLAPFAGLLLLSNLSLILRDQTDKIVLASMASPEVTGYFSMAQRLSAVVMQAHIVLLAPFTAAVGALNARDDWDGIRRLHSNVGSWMSVLAGMAGFLICTLREPLFILWLGEKHPETHAFLALLLFGVSSAIILAGAAVPLAKGVGRPGLETIYALLTLMLTLASKPLLIIAFGPIGSVASSAGAWCLGSLFMLFLVQRKLNLSAKVIWRNVCILLVSLVMSVIGWLLTRDVPVPAGRVLVAMVILGVGTVLAAVYLGVLMALRLVRLPLSRKASRVARAKTLLWSRT